MTSWRWLGVVGGQRGARVAHRHHHEVRGPRLHDGRRVRRPLPGIVGGFTITLVTLINSSAMAGAIGAGGLGDIA